VLVDVLARPVRPELYSDTFRKLCSKAGLGPVNLHSIRHTVAGAMNRNGVPIVDAAALMGHTPDVYVSTYLKKSESGVRSAAGVLGALAGGSRNAPETMPAFRRLEDRPNMTPTRQNVSGWRDLNSRPLDPQTSAACPRTSSDVQFP
jgi:hypothetical protein